MTVSKQDICKEEGSFTYNWVAGDTIEKGDVVEVHDDGKAYKGDGAHGFVGVADYAIATGKPFAAYGPSNKVWAKKGVGLTAGMYIKDGAAGAFVEGIATDAVGVCLEVDGDDCKVLLY